MNNYLLSVQYDGTNYNGWQNQNNAKSIQAEIEKSISIILKKQVKIIGSGRTDTGVHALEQKANFRVEELLDIYKFQFSLNSILPKDIAIKSIVQVPEAFHSRFDARIRTYIYLITNKKSPFFFRYSYFYPTNIDLDYLNETSKLILGMKDFSVFCKKKSEVENTFCEIISARWKKKKEFILFKISANRFLHGMVRTIIGTLLKAEKNRFTDKDFLSILNSKNRELAGESVPAKGLFLYKVEY